MAPKTKDAGPHPKARAGGKRKPADAAPPREVKRKLAPPSVLELKSVHHPSHGTVSVAPRW
jgi:hypothetical protein